jgi:NAD(P)-dependent dehydrogenase (short-subunit alcohol dehydrogenase family)
MTDSTSTALIIGETSRIGFATARKLAQLGIQTLVVGRNAERGKKAVELGNGQVDVLINNCRDLSFGACA